LSIGGVRIWRIFRLSGAAIRAIKCMEEYVEETGENVVGEDCVLWVDEGIEGLKIEVRLKPYVQDIRGCYSAIDSFKVGSCSLGNVSGNM
jgi:hypothetical protein